jgi:hypothetical protein
MPRTQSLILLEQSRAWSTQREGANVAARSKHLLPAELEGKFPVKWLFLIQNRGILEGNAVIICFLFLNGSVLGPNPRNNWVYLISAGLGPMIFFLLV